MEKVHLHFALHGLDQSKEYFIQGHGKKEKLQTYADNPNAFEAHKKTNLALASIPDTHKHLITHFIENIELSDKKISRLSVVTPAAKKDDILPDLVSVHIHIPTQAHRKNIKRLKTAQSGAKAKALPQPLIFKHLGIDQKLFAASANSTDVNSDAQLVILPPLSVAQTIVFHHPEIGTIDPTAASSLYSKYMQDQNNFDQLVNYVSNNPDSSSNPWYKKTYSIKLDPVTLKESPMTPTSRNFADGKPMDWPTDPVSGQQVIPQYELSDETTGASDGGVTGAAQSAVFSVLKQSKNDSAFNGSLWTRSQSTVSQKQTNVAPTNGNGFQTNGKQALANKKKSAAALADTSSYWSAKYDSDRQYGLDLYGDDVEFENNTLSLPVKNWPARILSVYIEYQKEDGTPIPWSVLKDSKEGENLIEPDGFISSAFGAVFAKHNAGAG